jgi:hypothetical protein
MRTSPKWRAILLKIHLNIIYVLKRGNSADGGSEARRKAEIKVPGLIQKASKPPLEISSLTALFQEPP